MSANDESPLAAPKAPSAKAGMTLWKSLEQRGGQRREPELPDGADQLDRRELFRLLGATLALSGVGSLAGCSRPPAEKIVPYRFRPPEMTPGNWMHYATMLSIDGYATGLLVRCREGRPLKVEGNPEHPAALGASGHLEQAQLMSLYDPGRLRRLTHRGRSAAVRGFFATLASYGARLEKNAGRGLYLFTEPNASPLLQHLKQRLKERFPEAVFLSYAPLSEENRYRGTRLAFGRPLEPVYDFLRADVVLSLDADFLDCVGHPLAYARAIAERRVPRDDAADPSRGMNRLYVVEPSLSHFGRVEALAFRRQLQRRFG